MKISLTKKILFGITLPLILIVIPALNKSSTAHAQSAPEAVNAACTKVASEAHTLSFLGFGVGITPNTTVETTDKDGMYVCKMYKPFTNTFVGYVFISKTGALVSPENGQAAGEYINKAPLFGGNWAINTQGKFTTAMDCNGLNFLTNFMTCGWRAINVGLGALSLSINAWLLGLVGLLFDWMVGHTIILFGSSIYTSAVSTSINTAWSAFRDIANIVIIGMFVYVAISIILDLAEYGQKKYVARVLVIAVLINFSLLFTKMIIDFSNFTATQFYYAAGNPAPDQTNIEIKTNGINPINGFSNTGIGGKFIQMSGVKGVVDATATLWDLSQKEQSGWLALLHGLFAGILFFATSLVLLYGCYILLVRAILIIFLLITSSLAFGSYLIPSKTVVSKGWTLWWDSLVKTALLAPILMIFLWATTKIMDVLSKGPDGQTLGTLMSNQNATNVGVLFNYLIVLGLLFMSFKLSNSLAGRIAGFNWPGMVASGAVGLASRFAVAPVLRQTVGRLAYGQAGQRTSEAKEAGRQGRLAMESAGAARTLADQLTQKQAATKNATLAAKYGRQAEEQRRIEAEQSAIAKRRETEAAQAARSAARYGTVAKGKMNVMDTGPAQAVAGAFGLKGFLAGQSKRALGYAGAVEARAKTAQKTASEVAPSIEDARREAQDRARREFRQGREQIRTLETALQPIRTSFNQLAQTVQQRDAAAQGMEEAARTLQQSQQVWGGSLDDARRLAAQAPPPAPPQTSVGGTESEMHHEAERIRHAQATSFVQAQNALEQKRQELGALEANVTNDHGSVENARAELERRRTELTSAEENLANLRETYRGNVDDFVREAGNQAAKAAIDFREKLVRAVAQQSSRTTILNTGDIAAKAVSIDQRGRTRVAQITRALRDEERETGGTSQETRPARNTPPPAT